MASGQTGQDVQEMFQRIGEKLGWFKQSCVDPGQFDTDLSSGKKKFTKSKPLSLKKSKRGEPGNKRLLEENGSSKTRKNASKSPRRNGQHYKDGSCSSRKPLKSAISFDNFLSSDSESNDEKQPQYLVDNSRFGLELGSKQRKVGKIKKANAAVKLCSDSEDEESIKKESTDYVNDTFHSCGKVSESPDCKLPFAVRNGSHSGRQSYMYDSTVVKNRESLASMTLDLEQLGEPLVESTRIHRRSSATFKQIMDYSGDGNKAEADDKMHSCVKSSKNVNAEVDILDSGLKSLNLRGDVDNEKLKAIDDTVDVRDEDEKFVTAVEILDETSIPNIDSVVKGVTDNERKCQDKKLKETTLQKALILSDSGESSDDIVEVVDVSTQTFDYCINYSISDTLTKQQNVYDYPTVVVENGERLGKENVHEDKTDFVSECNQEFEIESSKSGLDVELQVEGTKEKQFAGHNVTHDKGYCADDWRIPTEIDNVEYQDPIYEDKTELRETVVNEEETDTEEEKDVCVLFGDKKRNCIGYGNDTESVSVDSENDVHLPYGDDTDVGYSSEPQNIRYKQSAFVQSESETNKMEISRERGPYKVDCKAEECIDREKTNSLCSFDNALESDESVYEVVDVSTQTDHIEDDSDKADLNEMSLSKVDLQDKYSYSSESDHTNLSQESEPNGSTNAVSDEETKEKENCENGSVMLTLDNDTRKTSKNMEKKLKQQSDTEDESDVDDSTCNTNDCNGHASFQVEKGSIGKPEVSFSAVVTKATDRNRNAHSESLGSTVDSTAQSWRCRRKYSSESSEEDNLEAFFQKLRQPETRKAETPKSMKDFIVEDDEMTSESDDDAFYLRENQKLEHLSPEHRLKTIETLRDSEEDSDFSSKLYPASVTKQKRKRYKNKARPPQLSRSSSASSGNSQGSPRTHDQNPVEDSVPRGGVVAQTDILFKTPNPIRKKNAGSKISVANKENQMRTPKSEKLSGYISLSDSDESDNDCGFGECVTPEGPTRSWSSTSESSLDSSGARTPGTPALGMPARTPLSVKAVVGNSVTPKLGTSQSTQVYTYSFLRSLSNTVDNNLRDPEAKRFVTGFKKTKEELSAHLFRLYNSTVFQGKLPADMSLIWNKRLLRTAGYCAYKKNRANPEDRTARIELSTKVCDCAERVRDTLIHEMCHAAVWLLNGVNGGHGPYWKYWAKQASTVHPELPAISRCHSYSISTKFTYRCTQCGYSIGRHSKSLKTEKFACGYCRGKFELITNQTPVTPGSAVGSTAGTPKTPRTPNRFAMFVKDNYNTVKQKNKDLKHGDVMKELSKMFAANKISS